MAYEFFVLMQKRGDGKVYCDLHKTDEQMYLVEAEADAALIAKGDLAPYFHKVKLVAMTEDEWSKSRAKGDSNTTTGEYEDTK